MSDLYLILTLDMCLYYDGRNKWNLPQIMQIKQVKCFIYNLNVNEVQKED